jgi:hypothetical protein
MTVSDTIAQVGLVNHVNSIVSATASPTQPGAAGGAFKNGTVTTYSPDGSQKAAVGFISFEKTQFASDGSITGGQIFHSSSTPEGQPIASTTIQLGPGGKPTQGEIQINKRQGQGVFNVVNADLSAVQWTDAGKIGSGAIGLATKDPVSGLRTTSGSIAFQNEKFTSGAVTQYSAKDGTTIESLTELDFTGVALLGFKVNGGQMKVTRKRADQSVSSNSQVSFLENGLGRIKQVQTANLATGSNQVTSNVTADYSAISYNARNEIDSGDINIDVTGPDQSPMSHAIVSFAGAVPKTAQTWRFKGGVLANKTVTDYSNAQFDNHNRVVNGSIKVDVFNAAEQHISSTAVSYDQNGAVTNKQTQTFPVTAVATAPKTYQAVAASWTKPPAKPSAVAQPQSNVAPTATASAAASPGTSAAAPQTKNITRSDGTLEATVATTSQNGKPVSAVVTHYDSDGKTVVSSYHVDLTQVIVAAGQSKPSGSVSLQEFMGGTILHSESVFNY